MRKNVAGQFIGCQMISAADGSAFTGAVTVYVTGNAGTQAAGSVGSGICAHEGNGFHTYAPAQAETNFDHIGFTFVGTGAIPATVQVFTSFPQTGDTFARIGAPVGASVSADVAATKADTAAIKVKTDFLPSATAGAAGGVFIAGSNAATAVNFTGNLSGSVGSVSGAVGSVTGNVGGSVASVVGLNVANLDAAVSTRLASASYTAPPTVGAIADQVWDEPLSGHTVSGSTGEALTASGGAGDPWTTALPGSYAAGQAGYIVGTALNAPISSRATQASLDTLAGYVDTEVAAIKAKTDNLPASPAAVSDIPTAVQNADALLNRDMAAGTDSGSPTVRTVRQALRFLRNKWSISGSTLTVTKEDDATASWTATVSTTAGADPVTGTDPA